jgi:hypothetical protein
MNLLDWCFSFFKLSRFRISEVKGASKQDTQFTGSKRIGQGRGTRQQYSNRSGKSGHMSTTMVEKYLAGMCYPA